ncbi:Predicted NTP pyrophosphohydrolase, NUDIX family [Nakamurella panacisegetis]|uniref:Predicted NTP pyrophosphohydrolase, NUDIX family n=1 Tax=Nakamurella panacisegetis TaxID=1090615 RepID=A0A1H0QTB7_9ACTN|nr:NUDIX domain-containing protein [Nakamurella panacisegetis]SDP20574.1 Predicted NTP pyrophosphohydrolase, NUDIX family [Nakamurella panacisegetis]
MKTSAALLLHRIREDGEPELLLAHMGGPFWAKKDAAGWTIPKGEFEPGADPREAAIREFTEEMGRPPPEGDDVLLGTLRQSSAKSVTIFARAGNFDADHIASNMTEIEWPPRSGRRLEIPEVDRARWCTLDEAARLLIRGQVPVIDLLRQELSR